MCEGFWNVDLFLRTTARKQTYKDLLSLQGNCYPKAVFLQVFTGWAGQLWGPWSSLQELPLLMDSEQPTFPITWLPRSWANDLADRRVDSKTSLELFQLPSVIGSHWLRCNSKYTPPMLAKTMLHDRHSLQPLWSFVCRFIGVVDQCHDAFRYLYV